MNCAVGCNQESGTCEARPNPLIMALRFAVFGLGALVALGGMVKERRFKQIAAWLGAWTLFLTWPRYLICARCDGNGNKCCSYYLGRYTSAVFPRVKGKEVGPLGFDLEALCLSSIFWTPILALRDNRELLTRYLIIMQSVLAGQFLHACRWCAANSTQEWKEACPSYRTWKKLGA